MADFIGSRSPSDPLDQWVQTFEAVYTLMDSAIKEINDTGAQDTGVLRKSCGKGLHVRKITCEELRHNRALSLEVYNMALTGHVGFGRGKGSIHFRQDIAEKLKNARTFQMIFHDKSKGVEDEEGEEEDVTIESIDHADYAALIAFTSDQDLEKKEKNSHDTSSTPLPRATSLRNKKATLTHQSSLAVRNLASGIISQLKADQEGRRKRAEQMDEYQDDINRTKLKNRILKEQVKTEEIVATEKTKSILRSDLNADKPTQNG